MVYVTTKIPSFAGCSTDWGELKHSGDIVLESQRWNHSKLTGKPPGSLLHMNMAYKNIQVNEMLIIKLKIMKVSRHRKKGSTLWAIWKMKIDMTMTHWPDWLKLGCKITLKESLVLLRKAEDR